MYLELSAIRQKITQIDRNILKLLSERHRLAFDVAKNKEVHQKPLRDTEREKQLLQELVRFAELENYQLDAKYIIQIFQRIIEDSVLTQQNYLQDKLNNAYDRDVTIAFLGMKGSYSNLATRQFARFYKKELRELSCDSFQQIFDAVQNGTADYGVLPLENSTSGSINEVYDLLQHTALALVGELIYPVEHCVLATPETELANIGTLYSHPQVIQQCSRFIQQLEKVHIKYCESSSHAMQLVAQLNKPNIAALGNADGGKLYGLTVLKTDIANQHHNYTRFIVVAQQAVNVCSQIEAKTLLLMNTGQQAGALVDALSVFKKYAIPMTKLESRPIYGKPWEEMFYVELQANIHSENVQQALKELASVTSFLKILGCYPSEIIEPVKVAV